MFSIDRFDPSADRQADKQSRLHSFNDRLKRKRANVTEKSKEHTAGSLQLKEPAVAPTEDERLQISAIEQAEGQDTAPRKPHREKRKKAEPHSSLDDVEDQHLGQTKVSHILKTFHKIQERAEMKQQQQQTEEDIDLGTQEQESVADLAPIPQIASKSVKRSTIPASTGLAECFQHPTIVSSTQSMPLTDFPLCKKLQDNLQRCGFIDAFAVQAALLPVLLEDQLPELRRDLLISAPTGSGKTLAYAISILQTLQSRRVTRLRAVVIVPTKVLVQQVQATFEGLAAKLGLQIETASGTRPMALERTLLVNDYEPTAPSNVDILICTPGRLVEHIQSTPRFTLRDLRFLVVDEGDRLMEQSFQGWREQIIEALKSLEDEDASTFDIFATKSEERCQKLILSATLSTEPELLSDLKLFNPKVYLVQHASEGADSETSASKFTTPASLDEFFVHVPEIVPKPLVLLTAIHRLSIHKALIFTNSNESAIKLATLMGNLDIGRCEAITSTLTPALRRRHLLAFGPVTPQVNEPEIQFLVCSDLMARGIDITVACVLNYDSSVSNRQYIHRVGRTARAGKYGRAVSLVEGTEGKYWWNQIGKHIHRVKPIQRVTLFPKKDKMDGRDGNEAGDTQGREDGVLELDEEKEGNAAQSSRDVVDERPKQVRLLDVDMDALKSTYESALTALQKGRAQAR